MRNIIRKINIFFYKCSRRIEQNKIANEKELEEINKKGRQLEDDWYRYCHEKEDMENRHTQEQEELSNKYSY